MNVTPLQPLEIFLQPGDYYFGDKGTRIRTVLGSCVSMTFWHPRLLVGGMCHYMLPSRDNERRGGGAGPRPDGRYADEAMQLLMREIDEVGASHREYQVKLFGGGNMFPDARKKSDGHVGQRNVEMARALVNRHGFSCIAEHLGGIGHRNIMFDIWNGDVWVRHRDIVRTEEVETASGKRQERRLG